VQVRDAQAWGLKVKFADSTSAILTHSCTIEELPLRAFFFFSLTGS